MDDTRKEAVLDAENALREYMMSKREDAEKVLLEPNWQGIMVTIALDVATSGLPQDEALSTLLAMGWIAGHFHDDPEFQAVLENFPSATEVQEFWMAKVDEVVRNAQEELTRRPSEEPVDGTD
jgi:hypothetical protein